MDSNFSTLVILSLISVLASAALVLHAVQRMHVPGAGWFSLMCVSLAGLPLCNLLGLWIDSPLHKMVLLAIGGLFPWLELFCVLPLTLVLIRISKSFSRITLVLFALFPAVMGARELVHDVSDIMNSAATGVVSLPDFKQHLMGSDVSNYFVAYYLIVIILCLWGIVRRRDISSTGLILIVLSITTYLTTKFFPIVIISQFEFAPTVSILMSISYWTVIFRDNMLNIAPLAGSTLLNFMNEPVFVFDVQGNSVVENSTATAFKKNNSISVVSSGIELKLPDDLFLRIAGNPDGELLHDSSGGYWYTSHTPMMHKGAVCGWMTVVSDVSKVRKPYDDLHVSREHFKVLAEGSADLVLRLDNDLRIEFINGTVQSMLGFSVEEMVGTLFPDMMSEKDRALAHQMRDLRLSHEQRGIGTSAVCFQAQLKTSEGQNLWTEVNESPLRDAGGKISGYICTVRNIQRRKAEEAQLTAALNSEKQARTEQTHFMDMLAHEFRTPLAIIQSSADILSMQAGENQKLMPTVEKIQRALDRMSGLFEVSKALRSQAMGPSGMERFVVSIKSFVTSITEVARSFWGDRFVVTGLDDAEGLLVKINIESLQTALLNLMDNACKYSPPDRPIEISMCRSAGQVELKFCNRTVHPLADNPDLLINKYMRGSNTGGVGGTGMGLSMANDIIKLHGGRLTFEVEQQHAVTVTVYLPSETIKEDLDV